MQLFRFIAATALAVSSVSAAPANSSAGFRKDRVAFRSSGTEIIGYHYSPEGTQKGGSGKNVPGVIIAHGLGGLQTSRISEFGERFAAAGYHAMTFDYRYWGQSSGEPRNIIDVASQEDDYRAAVDYIKTLAGVDPERIVLWGTSLSGGHVLTLGAQMPELAAVIAQCPHVNGPTTVSALPPESLPGLIAAGLDDAGRGALGLPPLYIPLTNKTGQFGALTQTGAYEGYQFVQPNPPPPGNVFPARFVLQLPFFVPDATAANSKVPTFIAVGKTDNITPPSASIALAKRMNAELHEYEGGHFSVYYGASNYELNVQNQIAFLQKNVPIN